MIVEFKDKRDRLIFEGNSDRRFQPKLCKKITDKLRQIDAAVVLDDLKFPPSNRIHALGRDREGQHSISVNDAIRICFQWNGGKVIIEFIGDYH
ncbi:type II toxin-antitoxin system RelE/ParE family toxin [Leptospira stimsonii]|uniref:Plasmid maintenance system killer protein n=1 Tax=Leptospira stimsonii TaxID=2202203 RepID=A0ABY2N1W4_9LEPT|nr:type II toxin-antitoxin system RelE/ParE family toxin [Leptospira stimsonii]TGK12811.1 plasmid maintenance system killer protein [Leptospira stimsonii]TGM14467.1 plasmid maintenance system killer protein [Leptospira stimsonii]